MALGIKSKVGGSRAFWVSYLEPSRRSERRSDALCLDPFHPQSSCWFKRHKKKEKETFIISNPVLSFHQLESHIQDFASSPFMSFIFEYASYLTPAASDRVDLPQSPLRLYLSSLVSFQEPTCILSVVRASETFRRKTSSSTCNNDNKTRLMWVFVHVAQRDAP